MSSKPTAFITDDLEFDERGPIATGFFGGSLQTEDGGILDAIDEQMSVAEAIRWARERTDNVIVRITGEEPCFDTELDPSREFGRRRPTGWEFLDRTSAEPPISWDVILEMRPDEPLSSDGTWTDYATVPHSIVQVEASGYNDALAAAAAHAQGLIATRAVPTGSDAARRNARVESDGTLY